MELLPRAVVFLLDNFLETTRLKRESYLDTGLECLDIAESAQAEADRLGRQIVEAEVLKKALEKETADPGDDGKGG